MSIKDLDKMQGGAGDPLDLDRYVPHFLSNIVSKWTAAASRANLAAHGVGTAEWRVLASLSVFGEATSLEVANLIQLDAGAVSRAMTNLKARGYVATVVGRFKGRSMPFQMTESGLALYARMKSEALEREERLLSGLSPEQRETLLQLLRVMHGNLSAV